MTIVENNFLFQVIYARNNFKNYLTRCDCNTFMMSHYTYCIVNIFTINIIIIVIIITLLLFNRP